MQINPVHALLQLLRQETTSGQSPHTKKLKIDAITDLLETDRATNLRADTANKISQATNARVYLDAALAPELQPKARHKPFGHGIDGGTVDAINQAKMQRSGRGFDYTDPGNSTKAILHGDPSAPLPQESQPVLGVALPFIPTAEDIDRALKTGAGWPEEWGDAMRQSLLKERTSELPETSAGLAIRFLLGLALLIMAYLLLR